jgi:hypothetical protein
VTIASRSFGSQKEATEFFRVMLRSYKPGDRVSDTNTLHLAALLERHWEYVKSAAVSIIFRRDDGAWKGPVSPFARFFTSTRRET